MILLMVAGFLRPAEAMALRKEHVTEERLDLGYGRSAEALVVAVERSKTDQSGDGHRRVLIGRAQTDACALRWYGRWRAVWVLGATHVFHDVKEGNCLAAGTPRHRIRDVLTKAGVPEPASYDGHSARPGGTTEASRSGIGPRLVKRHGFWKSEAYQVYVHDDVAEQLSVSVAALPKAATAAPAAPGPAAARAAGPEPGVAPVAAAPQPRP